LISFRQSGSVGDPFFGAGRDTQAEAMTNAEYSERAARFLLIMSCCLDQSSCRVGRKRISLMSTSSGWLIAKP
jgi:hypothetical protein